MNASDHLAVRNVPSRYCQTLDAKDYPTLDKVFLPDVTANYPFDSNIKGREALIDAIKVRLAPIYTHHNLTTQTISFGEDGKTAKTNTDFYVAHFGKGEKKGKVVYVFGKYVDDLVLLDAADDYEGVPGASGVWRIKNRVCTFTEITGDKEILGF